MGAPPSRFPKGGHDPSLQGVGFDWALRMKNPIISLVRRVAQPPTLRGVFCIEWKAAGTVLGGDGETGAVSFLLDSRIFPPGVEALRRHGAENFILEEELKGAGLVIGGNTVDEDNGGRVRRCGA